MSRPCIDPSRQQSLQHAGLCDRQLEEMLAKLQPEGRAASEASRGAVGDSDPTTSTLQETMERLHGQHLSGSGDGVDTGSFMTPAGARYPQGRSPPDGVSLVHGYHLLLCLHPDGACTIEDACTLHMHVASSWTVWTMVHCCWIACSVKMLTVWRLVHCCWVVEMEYASAFHASWLW